MKKSLLLIGALATGAILTHILFPKPTRTIFIPLCPDTGDDNQEQSPAGQQAEEKQEDESDTLPQEEPVSPAHEVRS